MCTVTYIPNSNSGFCLTFNRDERSNRETVTPQYYSHADLQLLYPKDVQAGGTWIAVSENGKTACLLNGAFEKHERKSFYERSRGLVLLESFYYCSVQEFVYSVSLKNVEPFTLLLLDPQDKNDFLFFEFRWDGEEKYLKPISTEKPHIWSSSTLYNSSVRKKRNDIFLNWLKKHETFSDHEIMQFQTTRHGLSDSEDFIMQGQDDLKTLSIAQLIFDNSQLKFKYHDLLSEKSSQFNLRRKEVNHA